MIGLGHNSIAEELDDIRTELAEAKATIARLQWRIKYSDAIMFHGSLSAVDKAVGYRLVFSAREYVARESQAALADVASIRDSRVVRNATNKLLEHGLIKSVEYTGRKGRTNSYHLMTEEELAERAGEIAGMIDRGTSNAHLKDHRGTSNARLKDDRGASDVGLKTHNGALNVPLNGSGTKVAVYTQTNKEGKSKTETRAHENEREVRPPLVSKQKMNESLSSDFDKQAAQQCWWTEDGKLAVAGPLRNDLLALAKGDANRLERALLEAAPYVQEAGYGLRLLKSVRSRLSQALRYLDRDDERKPANGKPKSQSVEEYKAYLDKLVNG